MNANSQGQQLPHYSDEECRNFIDCWCPIPVRTYIARLAAGEAANTAIAPDLFDRIEHAISRITRGEGALRVPADNTDPDLVLAECRDVLTALTRMQSARRIEGPIALIAAERQRQVTAEGWTLEHDDEHTSGALAQAGGCYALDHALRSQGDAKERVPAPWPYDEEWWKPTPNDPIRQLVKAGALIVAEIERLQRAAPTPPAGQE